MQNQEPGPATQGKDPERQVVNITPYLAVARDLSALLTPVPVSPAYRTQLEQSLLVAARRQAARHTLDIEFPTVELTHSYSYRERAASAIQPVMDRVDRRWIVGAAAVGVGSAFSLAGLMAAYVWRQRRRQAA